MALARLEAVTRGEGVVEELAPKIASGEVQDNQLAASHDVDQPMDTVDEEAAESSDRPPSY